MRTSIFVLDITNEEKIEADRDPIVNSKAIDAGKSARIKGRLDIFLQDHQSFSELAIRSLGVGSFRRRACC